MNNESILEQFDEYLRDGSPWAAFTLREYLVSIEGEDAPIFPPTFAKPEDIKPSDWPGYNIDHFGDGHNVCLVDSVGSQANRMEPIFKAHALHNLVPQVIIRAGEHKVNLLDIGHRAGDAIVRFAAAQKDGGTPLAKDLWDAFVAWRDRGDAEPLAKIAPTSLVFGAWDSRATQAKVPRIVRSVIRAYDVKLANDGRRGLTRSAQYVPALSYVEGRLINAELDKGGESEKNPLQREGFKHNPAVGTPGGILASEIRRDALLNLVAVRALDVSQNDGEKEDEILARRFKLRRYILALALLALTHYDDARYSLREGCLLKTKGQKPTWKKIPFSGDDVEVPLNYENILKFAKVVTKEFEPRRFDPEVPFLFDAKKANEWLSLEKDTQDKLRRQAPIVEQGLPRPKSSGKSKIESAAESPVTPPSQE